MNSLRHPVVAVIHSGFKADFRRIVGLLLPENHPRFLRPLPEPANKNAGAFEANQPEFKRVISPNLLEDAIITFFIPEWSASGWSKCG
jgi:hypothetical protein